MSLVMVKVAVRVLTSLLQEERTKGAQMAARMARMVIFFILLLFECLIAITPQGFVYCFWVQNYYMFCDKIPVA